MKKTMTAKNILYVSIQVLSISAVSLLQLVDVKAMDLLYYVAVLSALGIGVIHVIITNRFLQTVASDPVQSGLWLLLLIVFFSVLIIGIIYYYAGLNTQFMTFIISYFIPYLCLQGYRYFSKIS
jgi:hypothetical protein